MNWTRADWFGAMKEYGMIVLIIGVLNIMVSLRTIHFLFLGFIVLTFGIYFGGAEQQYQSIQRGEI
jgi:hypothetical protein